MKKQKEIVALISKQVKEINLALSNPAVNNFDSIKRAVNYFRTEATRAKDDKALDLIKKIEDANLKLLKYLEKK
jgi:hypothetical protein